LESKLRNLYRLQQIDTHLDELEEMKGDLPGEVKKLQAELAAAEGRKDSLERDMREAFVQRDGADSDIIGLREKLEKYKKQQYAVRNNREYDALTREMDSAEETIGRLEKEMEALETKATVARSEIETMKGQIEELAALLKEKEAALAAVSKTTEDEELRFQHEREKVVARVAKSDIAVYERIRKAKKGKAVVPVKRGACGGCFNRVTPQRVLELRQNKRVHTCERCGRILVSPEIAETVAISE
jgi:predicted  nucleic acid-binding Zn-ribbon protein